LYSAPTGRNISAWGNAPGPEGAHNEVDVLKGRNSYSAPLGLAASHLR
jgi:hypothetical protein